MNGEDLPGFAATLLWTLAATAIVGVIAWLVLGVLRRLLTRGHGPGAVGGGRRGGGRLRIAQSVALGTRERAVLLVDDEREYLLGVAAGGVTLLASRALDEAAAPPGRAREADGGERRPLASPRASPPG